MTRIGSQSQRMGLTVWMKRTSLTKKIYMTTLKRKHQNPKMRNQRMRSREGKTGVMMTRSPRRKQRIGLKSIRKMKEKIKSREIVLMPWRMNLRARNRIQRKILKLPKLIRKRLKKQVTQRILLMQRTSKFMIWTAMILITIPWTAKMQVR